MICQSRQEVAILLSAYSLVGSWEKASRARVSKLAFSFRNKVGGNPLAPAHVLELLTTEPLVREKKTKLQESVASRMVTGLEWADEEIWVGAWNV
jgi:hypothetical protein